MDTRSRPPLGFLGLVATIAAVVIGAMAPTTVSAAQFPETIEFASKNRIVWSTSQFIDMVRGDLMTLRTQGIHSPAILSCVVNDVTTSSVTVGTPSSGIGWYFVVRLAPGVGDSYNVSYPGSQAVDRDNPIDGINASTNACSP